MPIYSDINEKTFSAILLVDVASIYQSIYNILNTKLGERIFLPEFGINLDDSIFDIITDETAFSILAQITGAINRWEPRVIVDFGRSSVTPDYINFTYNVNLVFQIPNLAGQIFEFSGLLRR